ncbi:unnamed protein product, partial [Didymodactylos carnosus]
RATVSAPWLAPHFLGSFACYTVGNHHKFSGYKGQQQRRVHFAGEHTSIGFQGYIKGGVVEGIQAAAEVLIDLDIVAAAA